MPPTEVRGREGGVGGEAQRIKWRESKTYSKLEDTGPNLRLLRDSVATWGGVVWGWFPYSVKGKKTQTVVLFSRRKSQESPRQPGLYTQFASSQKGDEWGQRI